MITREELADARGRIARKFIDQCVRGTQCKVLRGVKACGQFLDPASPQRGIHGTAAAIRVLGHDSGVKRDELLPALVKYIENRREIEEDLLTSDHFAGALEEQFLRDEANVIKLSEILYGLSYVPSLVYATDALIRQLANKLNAGKIDQRGWGYFIDQEKGDPELLPTAHAVLALANHGFRLDEEVAFIFSNLASRAPRARVDISVRVFCLYVLCFGNRGQPFPALPEDQLGQLFKDLWKKLASLLNDDIEQNVEYARNGDHFYVRVPWQLYLLALAAKLSPVRAFASQGVQMRLASIVKALGTEEGFVYPHSGNRASTRTNAITYDVLVNIQEQWPRNSLLLAPALAWDRIRKSRAFTYSGYSVAVAAMAYSVWRWAITGGDAKDVAPNFVAWLVLLLMTTRNRR